ncbi:MAG: glutamate--cysteine ligase [Burkholderiales bacterium]|nr:glutamate--cysteine ligase [Burkholderiales bacterium]
MDRLKSLSPDQLRGMCRGIEKESLRVQPNGSLAMTPHPVTLGSALTHPHVTTDFSESQLELVTGAHSQVESCIHELTQIHQFVYRAIGDEWLWASSMPCSLPAEEVIPIGQYGRSNVGQAKSIYRKGLAHRYGRRMQTISGIHYNWSMPGLSDADYFGLIRNFRRQSFLLLMLFGASPALASDFVSSPQHGLIPFDEHTLHLPHATSLRMGRLGYQSDAQSTLAVSYNSLNGYAESLQQALTQPYPPYDAIGLQDEYGRYKQLSTSLLQIENEFYSTIRPKRVIRTGERPLHALRERGVEYVEVRCMDLNPFMPIGIDADTVRFLDVFLLHCLMSPSPLDTPQEIAEWGRNQLAVAARGRAPGLELERQGQFVSLKDWALQILNECLQIAQALDNHQGLALYCNSVTRALERMHDFSMLPSARVLSQMSEISKAGHHGHTDFTMRRSIANRQALSAIDWPAEIQNRFEQEALASMQAQLDIESGDPRPFESFRKDYLSAEHLVPAHSSAGG